MNKIATLILAFGLAFSSFIVPASAANCAEQGGACRSWANSNLPSAGLTKAQGVAKCNAEVAACNKRCAGKKGTAGTFTGITVGLQYPITC